MYENDTNEYEESKEIVKKAQTEKSEPANGVESTLVDEHVVDNSTPEKYVTLKRMLNTLDRFLTQKLGIVIGICTLAIAACSMGLLINNTAGSSAGDGGSVSGNNPNTTVDVLLCGSRTESGYGIRLPALRR